MYCYVNMTHFLIKDNVDKIRKAAKDEMENLISKIIKTNEFLVKITFNSNFNIYIDISKYHFINFTLINYYTINNKYEINNDFKQLRVYYDSETTTLKF